MRINTILKRINIISIPCGKNDRTASGFRAPLWCCTCSICRNASTSNYLIILTGIQCNIGPHIPLNSVLKMFHFIGYIFNRIIC